jgi:hypothetical protein
LIGVVEEHDTPTLRSQTTSQSAFRIIASTALFALELPCRLCYHQSWTNFITTRGIHGQRGQRFSTLRALPTLSKSIASFCRNFAPCAPPHQSLLTTHGFLIASRQLLENELTCSQQKRKHFLIASFSAISELAPYLTNHGLPITPFLFATLARSFAYPLHFEIRQSPVATVELPPYD